MENFSLHTRGFFRNEKKHCSGLSPIEALEYTLGIEELVDTVLTNNDHRNFKS